VTDVDGSSVTTSSTATVTDAPLSASAINMQTVEGLNFSAFIASFSDANPFATVADFHATIDWGDGQTTPGLVVANGANFQVIGTHVYADEGSYVMHVHVADVAGSFADADGQVSVADAPLTATGASVTSVEGTAFSGVVANFSDGNSLATVADF